MTNESEGHERIVREAHALFLQRGFAEVSMQQIADAVGMTKASLYYHFKDKEELFAQVAQREIQRMLGGITAELESVGTLSEQLKRVALFFFKATQSDIGRLMSDFHRHVSEDSHERLHLAFRGGELDPIKTFRPYFEHAIAAGEMREIDVDFAIASFFSMCAGVCKFAGFKQDVAPLGEQQAALIVDVFLNGVGSERSRTEAIRDIGEAIAAG